MGRMELTRADVLAYRARVHDLEKRVPSPADCGSLAAGIRDSPPGRTARMALAARLGTTAASGMPGLADGGELAYAYTLRGAMHVHRAADLPVLAGAIAPRGPGDVTEDSFGPLTPDIPAPEAVERVADAMREVMGDGVARTKGELSGAVTARVDGRQAWTRPGILDRIRDVPGARAVRFLPPHDPLTELADRELLVADPAARREVWRATVNPGVLLVRGEIAGTVRLKVCSDKITVTVRTFGRLDPATQAAGEKEARRLAGLLGRSGSDTWYEPP